MDQWKVILQKIRIKNISLDNDFNELEYNNLASIIKLGNFQTTFKFIEENGEMGDSNILENSFKYKFNDLNSINLTLEEIEN